MRRKYYAEEGCIRLEMEIHGLNPEIDAATFKEISNAFSSRENGYLSDTNENFFLSVREMTEEERLSWVEKGYTTVLYKGADFNTEAALQNGTDFYKEVRF